MSVRFRKQDQRTVSTPDLNHKYLFMDLDGNLKSINHLRIVKDIELSGSSSAGDTLLFYEITDELPVTGQPKTLYVITGSGLFFVWNSTTLVYDNIGSGTGSIVLYTNPDPTPQNIGGIPAGSIFNNATMQEMWDMLLYPYQNPAFSTFSISGQSQTLEVGQELVGGIKLFNWSTTIPSNIVSNSIEIRDMIINNVIGSGLANDNSESLDIGSNILKSTNTNHTWRIQATNTESQTFNRNFTINWYWGIWYGESTDNVLDSDGIKALRIKSLQSNINGDYQFLADGYKYICHHDSLGTLTTFFDLNTGFAIPFEPHTIRSVTNDFGTVSSYKVYRSTNQLGSDVLIRVS
jgi:hypothetical protein